ncbi:hypothetical protein BGX30_006215 [Mortierella sp. GBA39]|nr:hypothetical protein BGX30_006215 [Mortierella sp. GBA39]
MDNNPLTLFCLVDGLPSSRAFEIEVSKIRTIAHLKDLIKAKQTPAFDDITVDQLNLWRVSIPIVEEDDELPILLANVTDKDRKKLGPATRLSKVFPEELPEETIHIISLHLSLLEPLPSLKILLQDRFRQVQSQISSFTSDSLTNKLLVVLDEAQTLSDHGKDHFVSSADSSDLRSILSPIIHGLRNISESGRDYCVVTCGTGIGADELEILVGSGGIAATLDQIDHRIVDFPGWESEDQVASYINNLGDAMSEDDRVRLHMLLPEAAVQELFFKLRGRFRPIITTIEDIIAKGSTSYWSEAIESRLSALVCYPERFPVRGNLCSDIKRMLDKVTRDPTKYADAVELKHVLKQTVAHRASLGLPWSLRGEEPILVESAFGRLRIAADKAAAGKAISTIIDEPFVFQAAYNFIKNEDEGFYKHFKEQYRDLLDPQSEGKIFERHAPLDLIYAFHKKQLKQELFSIPKAAVHRPTTKLKTPIP